MILQFLLYLICVFSDGMKDLLQSEVEGVNDKNVHFHGRCAHHDKDVDCGSTTIGVPDIFCSRDVLRCARTEVLSALVPLLKLPT